MPKRVRIDDQNRDATGTHYGSPSGDILIEPADAVVVSDPTVQTTPHTFTNAAKGATVALSATAAFTLPEAVTVTTVTYTPASTVAAPTAGNSRTWTLAGTEGTIATLVIDSTGSGLGSGVPISFTVTHAAVSAQTLTLASATVGTGFADPGGVVTLTEQF